ncbi:MAG: IS200/IS605 family transposase [Bacteroidota bacterium]
MPQSLSKVAIHIVFSTKNRTHEFTNPSIRDELHAYLGGTCKALRCPAIIVGGWTEHIHILCLLNRIISISDLLKGLKIESSKWLKTKDTHLRNFSWQAGYGVFSVSESSIEKVKRYIQNQEDHHRKKTFKEEYVEFLKENLISYNEQYVWD